MPLPVPPHVADDVNEARKLHDIVREDGVHGARGIVQGERALSRASTSSTTREAAETEDEAPS